MAATTVVMPIAPRACPHMLRREQPRRAAAAALLFATTWLFPAAARAQSLGEPVRLSYLAPAGCPSAADFQALVAARTTRLRNADATVAARSFTITIEGGPGGVRGTLLIREVDGREAARAVPGEDCREVAEALALMTAVAIDPDARVNPAQQPPSPGRPPAVSIPAAPRPPVTVPPPRRPVDPAELSGWRVSFGSHFFVTGAVAPDPVLGLQLLADVTRFSDKALRPTFRLSFVSGRSGLANTPDGNARFMWLSGRFEACPGTWPASALSPRADGSVRFGASPCALLDVGSLKGEGSSTADAATETRPWVAPGVLARVQLELFDALVLEAEGGATFPLLGYRYYFSPTTTVFTVPEAAFIGGLGLAVRFP